MEIRLSDRAGARGQVVSPESLMGVEVVNHAQWLLGKVLTTQIGGQVSQGIIVETEAYRAPEDKASHAYNGRRTPRTETMYRPGGRAYVYLCYGIHHLFNIVTGPEETAHAVLVRALEPFMGQDLMKSRRKKHGYALTSGPGSLSKAMGIHLGHDNVLLKRENGIWLEDWGIELCGEEIARSPRVGIDYAEEWVDVPWRLYVNGSPWVSRGA